MIWISFKIRKPKYGRDVIIYDPAYSGKVHFVVWENDIEADWSKSFWCYLKNPI